MPSRPAVPSALKRAVLVEAGHRCAIPTCKQVPVDLAHIVPWVDVRTHEFSNLIALCPTCHRRYDSGEINRQSMLMYKRNLSLVVSRYGESERRLLDMFAQHPQANVFRADKAMDFEFMYLIQDGLLVKLPREGGVLINGVPAGPESYQLTEPGVEFVNRMRDGREVAPDQD
jgi:HNH endonuclease